MKQYKCQYVYTRFKRLSKLYSYLHILFGHQNIRTFLTDYFVPLFLRKQIFIPKYVYEDHNLLHINGIHFPVWEIFTAKVYNLELSKKNPIIVDIGCNIGLSVIFFKNKFRTSIIYAYEPNKELAPLLIENISHNIPDIENVNVYFAAVVSQKNRNRILYTPNNNHTQSFMNKNYKERQTENLYKTQIVDVIKFNRIIKNFQKIDILKIDIEGGEFELISEIIKNHSKISHLIMEIHGYKNIRLSYIFNSLQKYFRIITLPAFSINVMLSGEINNLLNTDKYTLMLYAKHR